MKKYKIKNVDCANCAARIEDEVKKMDSVRHASINFASSVIYLDTDDAESVRKRIGEVEPGADIVSEDDQASDEFSVKKELLKLGGVLLLFFLAVLSDIYLPGQYQFISSVLYAAAYLDGGWKVLYKAGNNILRGRVFDENFLMTIATLGAIIIGEVQEAVAVMLFYRAGEFFQDLSVSRSRRSINSLMEVRPDSANLLIDGALKKVHPEAVKPGDVIVVHPGEKIPLDGKITEGDSDLDTSALTGESALRTASPGDEALAGMINTSGRIKIEVTRKFSESSVSKILDLVENAASRKAPTEKFITKFARYYTPAIVAIAAMTAFLPPLLFAGQTFNDWIYRALVILVVSCPCALVISIPLGYFGGIGGASKRGILVKGSNFMDALTDLKTVVFDKTGTLTKGKYKVSSIITANGYDRDKLLEYAAFAESGSSHPAAKSILAEYGKEPVHSGIEDIKEIAGRGVFSVIKGDQVLAGNIRLMQENGIENYQEGLKEAAVHIAVNGKYAGYITLEDELKPDAAGAVAKLKKLGVENIYMLTGDTAEPAVKTAAGVGINDYFFGLLPEDKVKKMEEIIAGHPEGKTAFAGDGINDAPVIARSDVGFAMGALGSDAAVETADIVLMEDKPSKVAEALEIAKKTRSIVWQNIIFALGVKLVFILLGAAGIATMWEAVFADMGVALIAILNSVRALRPG